MVSPIISVRSGSVPNSRISSCSICGCGLERVSSAVRVASKLPARPLMRKASFRPWRFLPVATASQWLRSRRLASSSGTPANSVTWSWLAK